MFKVSDAAFARWDLSHAHMFELADGRMLGPEPEDWAPEMLDEAAHPIASVLAQGDRFAYVFDLGDDWRHDCEVVEAGFDPVEVFGEVPPSPVPIWGWGSIPDQYGRDADDGGWQLGRGNGG